MKAGRGLSEREAQRFYDRYGRKLEWSDAFESRAKRRAWDLLALSAGEAVLEIGPGCGHFLAHACERVGERGRVVGVERSPTMLGLCRARAPRAHLLRASAARMPLAPDCFDAAFASYVLDLMPEETQDAVLAEFARVLRPGGRVVLCSLSEGRSALQKTLMATWKAIHRLDPVRVGGCRPLALAPRVRAAGFEIVVAEDVAQLGIPSEVLLARR